MYPGTDFIDHSKTETGIFKRKLLNIGHGRLKSLKKCIFKYLQNI